MAKLSGPDAIPVEHLALIGKVADAWSQLEFQIDVAIWHLAATEQQLSACITSQFMSIHPRLKALTALVTVRGGSEQSISDIQSFSGRVSGLAEKRNRCVHDPRYRDRTTGGITRLEITAKPKVQFGFLPEPKSELQEFIDRIYEKMEEFGHLRTRILNEIDALPPESRPQFLRITPVQ